MDRSSYPVKLIRLHEQEETALPYDRKTPAELMDIAWQLTCDVWAFKGGENAESGLQRHVVRLERRRS